MRCPTALGELFGSVALVEVKLDPASILKIGRSDANCYPRIGKVFK